MKELLDNLIKLQELDSLILSKRRFIEKVPYRILEKDLPLKQAQGELEKMQQKSEALNKKKRDKEKRIDEINEKTKKMKSRAADIKTNKEYQAHLKEIESSEKEISGIEEAILLIMDEFDVLSRLQKDKEANVKAERATLDVMREELDREAAQYERELSLIKEGRAALVSSIDPGDYKLYKRLIENCNGIAVVGAKNEVCGGCNMNVPPQLFVEIRKNEELLQCPQCYRILYYSEE